MKRICCILIFVLLAAGLFADEAFDGWKEVTTEHFRFIYEPRDADSVRELLVYAEDVYDEVTGFFDNYPDNITCVLRGRYDTANGFFSPFPLRIELYLHAPNDHLISSRNASWLKGLFLHEVVHYVHLVYNKGLFSILSYPFGPDVAAGTGAFLPGWFVEGIAVYLETKMTNGGRGTNPFFEMYYKGLLYEDDFFTFDQARYSPPFPPPGRHYVAGYIYVAYIVEKYGRDKFMEMYDRYVLFPFIGPDAHIGYAAGGSPQEIYDEMENDLRDEFGDSFALSRGEAVWGEAFHRIDDFHFADGKLFVMQGSYNKRYGIYEVDPEKNESSLLVSCLPGKFSVDKTGTQFVFNNLRNTYNNPYGTLIESDLYLHDTTSGETSKLTDGKHLHHPAISPSGNTIVAVQSKQAWSRLVLVDRETGGTTPLYEAEYARVYNPEFSDDEKYVVFEINSGGVNTIAVIEIATNSLKTLKGTYSQVYHPDFTSNGTIIYTSNRNGRLELMEYDTDTDVIRLLASDPVGIQEAQLNGSDIHYLSYSKDGHTLYSKRYPQNPAVAQPLSEHERIQMGAVDSIEDEKPYLDIGTYSFWLPVLGYNKNENGHQFSFGGTAYGFSNLGTHNWILYGLYDIQAQQMDASISNNFNFKVFSLDHSARVDYDKIAYQDGMIYRSTFTHQISANYPVVSESRYPWFSHLSFFGSLTHNSYGSSNTSFTFMEFADLSSPKIVRADLLTAGSGLSFSRGKSALRSQAWSPVLISTTLSVNDVLPVLNQKENGLFVNAKFQTKFPLFNGAIIMRTGVKAIFKEDTVPFGVSINPRGFATGLEHNFKYITSIDAAWTYGRFDLPWLFGLNFTGAYGSMYVENQFYHDLAFDNFSIDPDVYTGGTLVFDVNYNNYQIPFGIGAACVFYDPVTAVTKQLDGQDSSADIFQVSVFLVTSYDTF